MFVLAVPDLATSCAFYRDVLGFEVREIGDGGWRMLVRDSCRIMVGECPDAIPPGELGDHSYFGYLVVDDVDAYHSFVSDRGAEIVKPLRTEPWRMREFGVRTSDGHRIMFGQEVPDDSAMADDAPIAIRDLAYVSLYFERFEEAVAYYSSVFGEPGYSEPGEELKGWRMGETWLTIFGGSGGPAGGGDPRNAEFAVRVSRPDDVDRLSKRLVDAGAREVMAPRDTRMYETMRFACVDDPFGVRIDVYCPTTS